jgi:hypothetical protein
MVRRESNVDELAKSRSSLEEGKVSSKKVALEDCVPMPFDVNYSYIIHLMAGIPMEKAAILAYAKYVSFQFYPDTLSCVNPNNVIPRKEVEDIVNTTRKQVDTMVIYSGHTSKEVHPVLHKKLTTFSFVVPKGWDHADILLRMNPESTITEGILLGDLENFLRLLPQRIALDRCIFGKSYNKLTDEVYKRFASRSGIKVGKKERKMLVNGTFSHFGNEYFLKAFSAATIDSYDEHVFASAVKEAKKYQPTTFVTIDANLVFNMCIDILANYDVGMAMTNRFMCGYKQLLERHILHRDVNIDMEKCGDCMHLVVETVGKILGEASFLKKREFYFLRTPNEVAWFRRTEMEAAGMWNMTNAFKVVFNYDVYGAAL